LHKPFYSHNLYIFSSYTHLSTGWALEYYKIICIIFHYLLLFQQFRKYKENKMLLAKEGESFDNIKDHY